MHSPGRYYVIGFIHTRYCWSISLQYKSSALLLNVRPQKVVHGAIWLMNNNSLSKDEGIVFNQDWVTNYNEQISQHDIDDSECDQQSVNDEETYNNIDTKI